MLIIVSIILGLILFGLINSVLNITYLGGKALLVAMITCMMIVYGILEAVFT